MLGQLARMLGLPQRRPVIDVQLVRQDDQVTDGEPSGPVSDPPQAQSGGDQVSFER